jgi:hypothetical protein
MSDLDRQASGVPYYEPDYHYCKKCGCEMDWADCWMIDCEEGYYDLGEEDCINYDPGTYVKCSECEGNGGWWYCPNKECSGSPTTGSNDG